MKNSLLLLSALFLVSMSCNKKEDCVAGTGGEVTIAAFPQHHGKAIYNQANYLDSAFIKFNTQDFPGTDPSKYDLIVAGEEGEDMFTLKASSVVIITSTCQVGIPRSINA